VVKKETEKPATKHLLWRSRIQKEGGLAGKGKSEYECLCDVLLLRVAAGKGRIAKKKKRVLGD